MSQKIILTGGGTGGHVFPALTIASELKRRGYSVLYIGSDRGFEAKLAPEHGIDFISVKTGAIKNQGLLTKIRTVFRLFAATLWAIKTLRKEKASAVIGVGGYVSVPVCFAAFLMRLPLFLQEQNVSVGIANRFLGRFAAKVFLGFEQAANYFPRGKTTVTGNPIRPSLSSVGIDSYQPQKQCLLVMGGSQGAKAINDAILSRLSKLKGFEILHQTGERDLERVRDAYRAQGRGDAQVTAFIKDMAETYRNAAIVVSRSGALTVSELIQVGRPALLVPYPRVGQNDQVDNAKMLQAAGAGLCVEQGERFEERFWDAFDRMSNPERLRQMAQSYSRLRRDNAVGTIASHIEAVLKDSRRV